MDFSWVGEVTVVIVTGKKVLKRILIKPEVVNSNNVEMLEDLVLTACNEDIKNAEEETSDETEKFIGGLNIPGI